MNAWAHKGGPIRNDRTTLRSQEHFGWWRVGLESPFGGSQMCSHPPCSESALPGTKCRTQDGLLKKGEVLQPDTKRKALETEGVGRFSSRMPMYQDEASRILRFRPARLGHVRLDMSFCRHACKVKVFRLGEKVHLNGS